jgi:hypothetical protein
MQAAAGLSTGMGSISPKCRLWRRVARPVSALKVSLPVCLPVLCCGPVHGSCDARHPQRLSCHPCVTLHVSPYMCV